MSTARKVTLNRSTCWVPLFELRAEGRLAFFLMAGVSERKPEGVASIAGLVAAGGVTMAIVADVLCWGLCESNLWAAELVRW